MPRNASEPPSTPTSARCSPNGANAATSIPIRWPLIAPAATSPVLLASAKEAPPGGEAAVPTRSSRHAPRACYQVQQKSDPPDPFPLMLVLIRVHLGHHDQGRQRDRSWPEFLSQILTSRT